MKQYIDKDIIKAEIEKRIKVCQDYAKCNLTENTSIGNKAQHIELNDILSFIDALEVKEIEEPIKDLEEEIILWANAIPEIRLDDVERLAKYFFELGLKAQKGE